MKPDGSLLVGICIIVLFFALLVGGLEIVRRHYERVQKQKQKASFRPLGDFLESDVQTTEK